MPHHARRGPRRKAALLLLRFLRLAVPAAAGFCGSDWGDANDNCWTSCRADADCASPGHTCHEYTACAVAAAGGGGSGSGSTVDAGGAVAGGVTASAGDDSACGATWIAAMTSCAVPCPRGTECPRGQTCHLATGCAKPIDPIVSKQLLSMTGSFPGSAEMDEGDQAAFGAAVFGVLEGKLSQDKISVRSATVTGQSTKSRRLARRLYWNDVATGEAVRVELTFAQAQRRSLALDGASTLDVSMSVKGEYRPPPYLDVDLLIEESINEQSRKLVEDVRERGRRSGSAFFESVDGLAATRASAITPEPTARPTRPPTPRPTPPPTAGPTASPTRGSVQVAAAGTGADLYEGTSKSYGIVFEVRTQPGAPTLRVSGLDIYADVTGEVEYEVRSKEGGWEGFEGDADAFPVVAAGTAYSRGKCDAATADCASHFARIRGDFGDMGVRGGGGSRSFYVTLTTRDILYSSARPDDPEVLMETPGEATPVRLVCCCCVSVRLEPKLFCFLPSV